MEGQQTTEEFVLEKYTNMINYFSNVFAEVDGAQDVLDKLRSVDLSQIFAFGATYLQGASVFIESKDYDMLYQMVVTYVRYEVSQAKTSEAETELSQLLNMIKRMNAVMTDESRAKFVAYAQLFLRVLAQ